MCEITVLWLRPATGEYVSGRRERIADHLSDFDISVSLHDASDPSTIVKALTGDYDLIIGNVRIGLYLGYVFATIRRKPLLGDVSDSLADIDHLPRPLYAAVRWMEWQILERAAASFYVESESFETATERGLDPILARNAVDYEKFHEPERDCVDETRAILEENGISFEKPIALYVGSMVPHYHLAEVGAAADIASDWEFVFVGEERGADIESIVFNRPNAHFLGPYDYELMPGFMSHSTAGICLTDKEQPLKILEYGAAGLPTIGYHGKLRTNFSEDELVFADAKSTAIAAALDRIGSNPDFAASIGATLQQRAQEHSWKSIAEGYADQITNIVGEQ